MVSLHSSFESLSLYLSSSTNPLLSNPFPLLKHISFFSHRLLVYTKHCSLSSCPNHNHKTQIEWELVQLWEIEYGKISLRFPTKRIFRRRNPSFLPLRRFVRTHGRRSNGGARKLWSLRCRSSSKLARKYSLMANPEPSRPKNTLTCFEPFWVSSINPFSKVWNFGTWVVSESICFFCLLH